MCQVTSTPAPLRELAARLAPHLPPDNLLSEPQAPSTLSPAGEKLWLLYALAYEVHMNASPISASMIGDYRYNDQIGDRSREGFDKVNRCYQNILEEAEKIDEKDLSEEDVENLLFLKELCKSEVLKHEDWQYAIPLTHMFGAFNTFMGLSNFSPIRDAKDAADYLKRIRQFPLLADQIIEAFTFGIKQKTTLPVFSIEAIISQFQAQVDTPPENIIMYKGKEAKMREVGADAEADGVLISLRDEFIPSCKKIVEFLRAEYLPVARESDGLWSWPDFERIYKGTLQFWTSTDLTAEEVHRLGLEQVERISAEIEKMKNKLGYNDLSLKAFIDVVRHDERFVPTSGEHILEEYRKCIEKAKEAAPALFNKMPKAECEVRAIEEYRHASAPPAHYYPPPTDNSRPAIFYANTYKPETRPLFTTESIGLHEAIPGHHFQLALAQELTGLPRLRTLSAHFTMGYCEGWGLYTEKLGLEMGFYTDPYQDFGRLSTEMMRAIRLVVDTGLHHYKWTVDKAIAYFSSLSAMGDVDIKNEVYRYCIFPGQACSYKVGELKILELRKFAEDELGSKFNICEFHDTVLGSGSLPLSMLDTIVRRWVAKVKAQ